MTEKTNIQRRIFSSKRATDRESGRIVSLFSGVALLEGLDRVFVHETLLDKTGDPVAIVAGFDRDRVAALLFRPVLSGEVFFRSGTRFSVPVSREHIGRTLNGFGAPIDDFGRVGGRKRSVFAEAPSIIDREPISVPLSTGIKVIDANLPIGRGQRELIIGDRKLGKSTLAIDTILHQKHADRPVVCIYVLIGQKEQKLHEVVSAFDAHNAFLYTIVVAGLAGTSLAEQYLAPFVGATIGEYFRDRGEDALVVYDDLSKHANTYRDISLLLGRPPGREAYPGDIFSLHAGLLERAGRLAARNGGGSLTALPIVETEEGDISSFLPTNIISITDGQIYLEQGLFRKGFIPAVNIGLSVSRVGSEAQPSILRETASGMRLALSRYKELQRLSQMETTVSEEARKKMHRGGLLLSVLKQGRHEGVSWPEQAVLFYSVDAGLFDDMDEDRWPTFEKLLLSLLRNRYISLLDSIRSGRFDEGIKRTIETIALDFKQEFLSESSI